MDGHPDGHHHTMILPIWISLIYQVTSNVYYFIYYVPSGVAFSTAGHHWSPPKNLSSEEIRTIHPQKVLCGWRIQKNWILVCEIGMLMIQLFFIMNKWLIKFTVHRVQLLPIGGTARFRLDIPPCLEYPYSYSYCWSSLLCWRSTHSGIKVCRN